MLHLVNFHRSLATGIPGLHLLNIRKKGDKFIEKKNKLNIRRVKMSSIVDEKQNNLCN